MTDHDGEYMDNVITPGEKRTAGAVVDPYGAPIYSEAT
jgi:hypothetical protein